MSNADVDLAIITDIESGHDIHSDPCGNGLLFDIIIIIWLIIHVYRIIVYTVLYRNRLPKGESNNMHFIILSTSRINFVRHCAILIIRFSKNV